MNSFERGGYVVVTDAQSLDDAQVSGSWMKAREENTVEVVV